MWRDMHIGKPRWFDRHNFSKVPLWSVKTIYILTSPATYKAVHTYKTTRMAKRHDTAHVGPSACCISPRQVMRLRWFMCSKRYETSRLAATAQAAKTWPRWTSKGEVKRQWLEWSPTCSQDPTLTMKCLNGQCGVTLQKWSLSTTCGLLQLARQLT